MQTENRAAPHLALGVLTLLGAGALVLSLDTAPPNEQQQLRSAASNLSGADSFVLTDEVITAPPGASPNSSTVSRQQAEFVYQAPDRVEETISTGTRTGSVLWIGRKSYERLGTGKWFPLAVSSSSSVPAGQLAAQELLYPLQAVAASGGVKLHGTIYVFTPQQPQVLLSKLFGAGLPAGNAVFEATVQGDFARIVQVTVVGATERRTVDLVLTQINSAPALDVPPASDITSLPTGR